MTGPHATHDSRFPPAEHVFAGHLMMQVAQGVRDRDDLLSWISDTLETDEFPHVFPQDPVPDLAGAEATLDAVVAEHDRVVRETSADAAALLSAFEALSAGGIAVSFGATWDAAEGAHDGYERALAMAPAPPWWRPGARRRHQGARGYVYSHSQDLDGLIENGLLLLGFGAVDPGDDDRSPDLAIGRDAAEALRDAGLPVSWDDSARSRIAIGPMRWERPYGADGPQPLP